MTAIVSVVPTALVPAIFPVYACVLSPVLNLERASSTPFDM